MLKQVKHVQDTTDETVLSDIHLKKVTAEETNSVSEPTQNSWMPHLTFRTN